MDRWLLVAVTLYSSLLPIVPLMAAESADAQTAAPANDDADAAPSLPEVAGGRAGALFIPTRPVSHPDIHFLDRTEIFWSRGLLLEAQTAPNLFAFDSTDSTPFRQKGGTGVSVVLTPLFKIRILNQLSPLSVHNPPYDWSGVVKTLSFMPKATVNIVHLFANQQLCNPNDPPLGQCWGDHAWMLAGQVIPYGHHSNGQDECPFKPGAPNVNDPAVCFPSDPDNLQINYPNGKFTTNYMQVGIFAKRYRLVEDLNPPPDGLGSRKRPDAVLSFGLRFETQIRYGPGGPLRQQFYKTYGKNRVYGLLEWEKRVEGVAWLKGSIRFTARPQFIDKEPGSGLDRSTGLTRNIGAHRFGGSVEAAWTPDALRGWGVLVRGDYGQDYYNLQFLYDLKRVSVGLVFDPSEFEYFLHVRRPTPATADRPHQP